MRRAAWHPTPGGTRDGLKAELGATVLMIGGRVGDNGSRGVRATLGSRVELDAVKVDFNVGGVEVRESSLLRLAGGSSGLVEIRDNTGDGLTLMDTSVVSASGYVITANGGRGIFCDGVPSSAQLLGTFSAATIFAKTGLNADGCPGITIP